MRLRRAGSVDSAGLLAGFLLGFISLYVTEKNTMNSFFDDPKKFASLVQELTNGYGAILKARDGAEIFAMRVGIDTSVLDREYDFAGISWSDDTKAAFLSGDLDSRSVFFGATGRGETLYQVLFVAEKLWEDFEIIETTHVRNPSFTMSASELGCDAILLESDTRMDVGFGSRA